MKTSILIIALLASGLSSIQAQYQVVEHGANYRVLQKTTIENGTNRVHRYTEVATGLYFTNSNGQLMESKEEIETFTRGAIARQGPYQVIFANNLNSAGAIDLQTPDGKRLRSNILGLAYNDDSTGKSVLFAQIQDSQGELISSNQVLYPDAFAGVNADVRYTYRKGSFEQDVIMRAQPPAPESFGLNPQTTEIEVLTEFINPPQVKVAEHKMKNSSLPDDDVDWGVTRIGHGRAFDLGGSQNNHSRVTVRRQYVTAQNRNILVEGVPIQTIKTSLANLPSQSSATSRQPAMASKTLALPKTPLAQTEQKPMKLASASPSNKGFVLDYVELNTDTSDFTFQTGTTYFINGGMNIGGTATFEGGTVLKFSENSWGIYCSGSVVFDTSPGQMAVFTSENDDSAGEPLPWSNGFPTSDPSYFGFGQSVTVSHCLFRYAGTVMTTHGAADLNDVQFFNCGWGIVPCDDVTLNNALVHGCYIFCDGGMEGQNTTFENGFAAADGTSTFCYCSFSGMDNEVYDLYGYGATASDCGIGGGYQYPPNYDSDFDGLSDAWEMQYFGNLNHTGSELDVNGNTLLFDYTNGVDPVKIDFWMEPTSSYANTPLLTVPLNITAGTPLYKAVLVDNNDFASATWTAYTSSNITVNLGATEGWHRVWIGLASQHPDISQVWEDEEFKLDTVPPVVVLVNPAAITPSGVTVIKPYLQLQGNGNEQLGLITYDIANAAGVITNQPGAVTGQFFDTNCLDYTTNNFQCYDVPLTNGLNLITLHVSDLAGNMTTTNIAVTLDYSLATDPPVVTLIWPQDGMTVSGTNITIRGTTSDETGTVVAQVVNGDSTTTTVQGLVERNGMFWLENVPLNGTSQISIQATDASGNNTTTMDPITLLPSDMVLTIDSTPTGDNLYQSSGTVSGTVSDGDYDVWVNGVEADDYWFDGTTWNWQADNVPIYGMGTATFDAVAYPPEQQAQAMARAMDSSSPASPPINADTDVEKQPFVELVQYDETKAYSMPGLVVSWDRHYIVNYSDNRRTYTGICHIHQSIPSPFDEVDSWSDADPVGTAYVSDSVLGDFTFPLSGGGSVFADSMSVPDYDLSAAWYNINGDSYWWVTHFFGRGVHYEYGEGDNKGIEDLYGTSTRWVLHTGGKAKSGRMNLFCISIPDYNPKYKMPLNYTWGQTPEEKMDPTTVGVLGDHFRSDGNYWTVQPDGAAPDLGITVAADHASLEPWQQKYKSQFQVFVRMPWPKYPNYVFNNDPESPFYYPQPWFYPYFILTSVAAGHAWWELTSDAPIDVIKRQLIKQQLNPDSTKWKGMETGFCPLYGLGIFDYADGFNSWASLHVPGMVDLDGWNTDVGPANTNSIYSIGFPNLIAGLNHVENFANNIGYWDSRCDNCAEETLKTGGAVGVTLPSGSDDWLPEYFGYHLPPSTP